MIKTAGMVLALVFSSNALNASELCPKYGECVPADQFECQDVSRSSFITRVCYNEPGSYMIIRLDQTDYHYCSIGADDVSALMSASSMGRHYNQNIKGDGSDGPFDCRSHPIPVFD